jgi:hypothetical protein
MQELNIVELIENNPISKLSKEYNNKLLNKIKENFTGFEQQLFVSSFYCYLNYDKNLDFIIDLDNVWKWIGFKQKIDCKRLLEKHFKLDVDYKNLALGNTKASSIDEKIDNFYLSIDNKNVTPGVAGSSLIDEKSDFVITKALSVKHGGQNKQTILLTIKCFKSLCLKAQTSKASEIHEYYIKMEEVLHEIVEEETDELKLQLKKKDNLILEQEKEKQIFLIKSLKEKQKAVEKSIVTQFPVNTQCVYFGTIDNTNQSNEKLIKFGHTNDLNIRLSYHHKTYNNFILTHAFRVQNKVEIENLIKNHEKIRKQIRTIEVDGKNKTEIICYDDTDFTIDKLCKYIKDIINDKTYSIDNFNKLLKQNEDLENELRELKEINKNQEKNIFEKELYINELIEKNEKKEKIIDSVNNENKSVYKNELLPVNELHEKFDEFVNKVCVVHPEVEELSTSIEGRFRIWHGVKPKKEVFHALKNYLDIRFKPKKIDTQHGYIGIRLNPVEYKKSGTNSDVENFIFNSCKFSDNSKVLDSVLFQEYQKWRISIGKELTDNDLKDIKEYLKACPYALRATVWTQDGSNEGFYGLCMKQNEYKPKYTSSTGKKVYKREVETHILLKTWDTIVSASEYENISKASMSRCVKNKTVIDNYYYTDS